MLTLSLLVCVASLYYFVLYTGHVYKLFTYITFTYIQTSSDSKKLKKSYGDFVLIIESQPIRTSINFVLIIESQPIRTSIKTQSEMTKEIRLYVYITKNRSTLIDVYINEQ